MIAMTDQMQIDYLDDLIEQKERFEKLFSNKKNAEEWLKMPWAMFSRMIRIPNPQLTANKIEQYLCNFYGWTHLKSNKESGDAIDENGQAIEIKHSFITPSNQQLNIKQARIDWDGSAYRVFAFEKDKVFRFDLTHEQISLEIANSGAVKTHKNGQDYSMSIPWSPINTDYQRWMREYLSDKPVPV